MTQPLGLYVHIPWCVRKCPYCDFNSHEAQHFPEREYVQRLIQDLEDDLQRAEGRKISSMFFGGGTPSLFSATSIATVITSARELYGLVPDAEITLEANPGTADAANFLGYRKAGVNRLSIGVQSFSDQSLSELGRIHSAGEAHAAIQMARKCGFSNINVDLMHGLPGQTVTAGLNDLQRAIAYNAEHISWYQLTIEPNTHFYSKPPQLPAESNLEEIQLRGHELLVSAGYQHYEVSAYGHADHRGHHNLNYWRFGDYLGIGAGAHGKTTHQTLGTQERYWRRRQPAEYLDQGKDTVAGSRHLSEDELMEEYLMNALRQRDGFSLKQFERATGLQASSLQRRLAELVDQGLLCEENNHIACTAVGWQFLDSVLTALLTEENQ